MRGGCGCVCSQALLPADMHKMGMRISGATGKAKLKVGGHHAFLGQLLSCYPGSDWCMTVIVVPSWVSADERQLLSCHPGLALKRDIDSYCHAILGQRWWATVIVVPSWVSAEAWHWQLLSCHPGPALKRDSYCHAILGQRWSVTVIVLPSWVSTEAWQLLCLPGSALMHGCMW